MINPGELRQVIEIQDFSTITDENGFEITDYKTMYKLRAKVKTQGTKEFMSADKATTKLTLHVICRKRRNIDSNKFLLYKNKRYNIRHVHILEDGQFLQLTIEGVE
ncbi:phage head closure protein [Paraclostridium tenue]